MALFAMASHEIVIRMPRVCCCQWPPNSAIMRLPYLLHLCVCAWSRQGGAQVRQWLQAVCLAFAMNTRLHQDTNSRITCMERTIILWNMWGGPLLYVGLRTTSCHCAGHGSTLLGLLHFNGLNLWCIAVSRYLGILWRLLTFIKPVFLVNPEWYCNQTLMWHAKTCTCLSALIARLLSCNISGTKIPTG